MGDTTNLGLMSGFPEEPTKQEAKEVAELCLATRAVDLAEVHSPPCFKERAMQLGLRLQTF